MSLPAIFDQYLDEEVRVRCIAEGRLKGIAEGRAEGIAEGRLKGIAEGRLKGIAEGKAEGERLQAFATAKELLRMGLEVQKISIATGLSVAEIEPLQ